MITELEKLKTYAACDTRTCSGECVNSGNCKKFGPPALRWQGILANAIEIIEALDGVISKQSTKKRLDETSGSEVPAKPVKIPTTNTNSVTSSEVENYKYQIDALEKQIKLLKAESETEKKNSQETLSKVAEECKRLQKELDDSKKIIKTRETDISSLMTIISYRNSEIQELRTKLESAQKKFPSNEKILNDPFAPYEYHLVPTFPPLFDREITTPHYDPNWRNDSITKSIDRYIECASPKKDSQKK